MPCTPSEPSGLLIRPSHLALVLGCSEQTINTYIAKGKLPKPDGRGLGGLKLWALETIRAWNPSVGKAVLELFANPAFSPYSGPLRHTKALAH